MHTQSSSPPPPPPYFSSSVPAPLFYTPDDIPDFLIRSSLGEWAEGYLRSSLFVLDGSNGAVVWSFNTSNMGMMSTISYMSRTYGRDAMIFYTVDADYEAMAFGDGDHNGAGPKAGGDSMASATSSPPIVNTRRRRHSNQGPPAMGGEAEKDYNEEDGHEEGEDEGEMPGE